MKAYYLLDVGDLVRDGDEEYSTSLLHECRSDWREVPIVLIGEHVQQNDPPIRRSYKHTCTCKSKGTK